MSKTKRLDERVPYEEPLDDVTERIITDVCGAADNFGRLGHRPVDFRFLEARTDALRARIRQLQEEAAERARRTVEAAWKGYAR